MKLEVGKYYKTRGGHKARVVCDDLKGSFRPILALVECGKVEHVLYSNTLGFVSDDENQYDLVSEWIDKPEFDWSKAAAWHVAVAKAAISDKWYAFDKIPEYRCSRACYAYVKGSILDCGEQIPDQYAPVWEGGVRDSLIIRPGYEVIS